MSYPRFDGHLKGGHNELPHTVTPYRGGCYEQKKFLVEERSADRVGCRDERDSRLRANRGLKSICRSKVLRRLRKHGRAEPWNPGIPLEDVGGSQCLYLRSRGLDIAQASNAMPGKSSTTRLRHQRRPNHHRGVWRGPPPGHRCGPGKRSGHPALQPGILAHRVRGDYWWDSIRHLCRRKRK